MRKLTNEELQTILEKHKKWLKGEEDGEQADLSGVDLYNANLIFTILHRANLAGANLYGANLYGANLCEANLYRANLSVANLTGANLTGANATWANLTGANLTGANLTNTDMQYVGLERIHIDEDTINKYFPLVCPSEGSFIGWKKVRNNMIVKLLIPEDAKRSSAFGRKCRCNKAVVLSIESIDGTPAKENYIASSIINSDFTYKVGETVSVSNFCTDRKMECAPGIHFFITREEAVEYSF